MNVPQFFVVAIFVIAATGSHAMVIFEETFSGSSSSPLDGTAPEVRPGTETWISGAGFSADGSMTNSGSAWLPYALGNEVYEINLGIDLTPSSSTAYMAISFITSNQPWSTSTFNGVTGTYTTFGFRPNRDVEFWAGDRNNGNVDGGRLSSLVSLTGQIRMVLNLTGTNWTVDVFYTPNGGSEIVLDINGTDAGTAYTYATNPPSIKGIGITSNVNSAGRFTHYSLSVIPEPSSVVLIGLGLGALYLRTRQQIFN